MGRDYVASAEIERKWDEEMKIKMVHDARSLFWIALIGAAITLLGDILIGANPAATELTGVMMLDMFQDAADNSEVRMILGGMLGAVGISFTGVGYYQIYQFLKHRRGVMPYVYQLSTLLFIGLAGAGTHLSCAAIPMLYKWIAESDPALAAVVTIRYANCFMMPPTILFGVLLFVALIYQTVVIWKEETAYPRYAVFYNMVFGVIAAYTAAAIIGNNVVGNGIGTGAISIGHMWMFGMMLFKCPEEYRLQACCKF